MAPDLVFILWFLMLEVPIPGRSCLAFQIWAESSKSRSARLQMGPLAAIGKADIGDLGKLPMFHFMKTVVFSFVDWAFVAGEYESRLA